MTISQENVELIIGASVPIIGSLLGIIKGTKWYKNKIFKSIYDILVKQVYILYDEIVRDAKAKSENGLTSDEVRDLKETIRERVGKDLHGKAKELFVTWSDENLGMLIDDVVSKVKATSWTETRHPITLVEARKRIFGK